MQRRRVKILRSAALGALLLALACSRPASKELLTWGSPSPLERHTASVFLTPGRGLMSDHWQVKVFQMADKASIPSSEHLVYDSYSCGVFYVFWLTENHLEIQLAPWTDSCPTEKTQVKPPDGLTVTVTRPSGTSKRAVMATDVN